MKRENKKRFLQRLLLSVLSVAMAVTCLFAVPSRSSSVFADDVVVPEFEHELLYGSGSDEGKIVIMILGDGYTASEQGPFDDTQKNSYMKSAKAMADYIAGTEPYRQFADKLNIHGVKAISNVSGIGGAQPVDSYFRIYNRWGTTYIHPDNLGMERVRAVVKKYAPTTAAIALIANVDAGIKYAPCAMISWKTMCVTRDSGNSFVGHEMAHALSAITDEYDGANPSECPNVSRESDPTKVRWRNFIGIKAGQLGPYENDISHVSIPGGWYKTGASCQMNNGRYFCSVCTAAMVETMAMITDEPFYGTLYEGIRPERTVNTATELDFPSGRNRILPYALHGLEKLKTLKIPSSVKTIGNYAFLKCTALERIDNRAAEPQDITGNDRFRFVDRSKITVHVPVGSKAAYERAGWTGFRQIVEDAETEPLIDAEVPTIRVQPQDYALQEADWVILRVSATSAKGRIRFQWYVSSSATDQTSGTAIPGGKWSRLYVPAPEVGTHYYYCVVTNTDDQATGKQEAKTTSRSAKITVAAADRSKDDFDITKYYRIGDRVIFLSKTYECTMPWVGVKPSESYSWEQISLNGAYIFGKRYSRGDVVKHQGKSWKAKRTTMSVPDTDHSWEEN